MPAAPMTYAAVRCPLPGSEPGGDGRGGATVPEPSGVDARIGFRGPARQLGPASGAFFSTGTATATLAARSGTVIVCDHGS